MRRLSSGSIMNVRTFIVLIACSMQFLLGQSSPHGPLKQACTDCHTTSSWKDLAVPMKFNHAVTGFILQGAHSNTQCIQCHTTKRFAGTSSDCFSCHKKDFSKAMSPNHQVGLISHECLSCHTINSWRPSIFDHAKTNFQLVGAHSSVECSSCHTGNKYKGLPSDCFSCHQKDYAAAKTPNHSAGQFSRTCLTCHTINTWKPSTFDHNKTNFALVGSHQSVECSSCHKTGRFKGLAQDCYSCHQKDYAASVNPNHAATQMDHSCLNCHTLNSWSPSTFDHAKTDFKLTGAHTASACSKCHSTGTFKGTAKECYPCHLKDITKLVTPDHIKGQFSQDCLTCHTNMLWKPSTFDHAKTNYALTGAHIKTECKKCHVNELYKNLPATCYSCHQKDFTEVLTPNHQTGQFNHDCTTCHSTTIWKPSTFDHNKTAFALKGAHVSVDCASCHKNGQFKGTTADCYSCHLLDYNRVLIPNHLAGAFSHDCLTCHTINAWKPSTFNHSTTAFPLVGAHVTVSCASCHTNGQFKGTATDCFSCHQSNFNSTTAPNHVTSLFSHDCLTCHTNTAWKPASFNHSATAFPLLGAHAAVTCASCHSSGQYKGLATDCYSCHQKNFTAVVNPNHVSGQFSHDCITCHSNTVWKPSTFNHSSTAFPLVGAHTSVTCASCHTNGQFKGLPSDCFSCHQTKFNATTDPNHVTAQFSHDCLTCHTTTAWKPSTFNHSTTSFPLLGAHAAVTCGDCHKNGQFKGTTTVCYNCHTSDFTGVTDPNHVTNAFDHACLTCHTMTGWKPATFNHSKTRFPLTGKHASTTCISCHAGGKYAGTTMDCYTCHLTDYNGTKNPNHVTGNYNAARACNTCHNTSVWQPWIFGHNTYYNISKHHNSSVTCAKCHLTPGNLTTASCTTGCHSSAHHKTQTCYIGSNCHAGSNN
ncbi:MAG: hypothetical protein ACOYNS_02490 [Bacteroidota bacterium]